MEEKNNFKSYVFGGLIGALIGVVAAYLIENSPDLEEGENPFNRKRLSKLGLSTVSMLWGLLNSGKGR